MYGETHFKKKPNFTPTSYKTEARTGYGSSSTNRENLLIS